MNPEAEIVRDPRPLLQRPIILWTLVAILIAVDGLTKAHAVQEGNAVFNPRPAPQVAYLLLLILAVNVANPSSSIGGLGWSLILAGGLGNLLWMQGIGVPDFIMLPGASNELTIPLSLIGVYPKGAAVANVADLLIMAGVVVLACGIPAAFFQYQQRKLDRLDAGQKSREAALIAAVQREQDEKDAANMPSSTGL